MIQRPQKSAKISQNEPKTPRIKRSFKKLGLGHSAKITPSAGYHTTTLADALVGDDDDLVSFPAAVLKVNSDHYEVRDLAIGSDIIVKPNTGGLVTTLFGCGAPDAGASVGF